MIDYNHMFVVVCQLIQAFSCLSVAIDKKYKGIFLFADIIDNTLFKISRSNTQVIDILMIDEKFLWQDLRNLHKIFPNFNRTGIVFQVVFG
jgi:hypothetical protein